MGRSRGGPTPKIHALGDADGLPISAGRRRPAALRNVGRGEPVRSRQEVPLSTLRASERGTPRGLFRKSGAMIDPPKTGYARINPYHIHRH